MQFWWDGRIGFSCRTRGSTWNVNYVFWSNESTNISIQWQIWVLIFIYWCSFCLGWYSCWKWLTIRSWIIFLNAETVCLATKRDCSVPALWYWLIPMVIILNNNIILPSFLHNTSDRIQKYYSFFCLNMAYIIITSV